LTCVVQKLQLLRLLTSARCNRGVEENVRSGALYRLRMSSVLGLPRVFEYSSLTISGCSFWS